MYCRFSGNRGKRYNFFFFPLLPLPLFFQNVIYMFLFLLPMKLFGCNRFPHLVLCCCHISCVLYSLQTTLVLQELSNARRMKWWFLWWLLLSLVFHNITCGSSQENKNPCSQENKNPGSQGNEDPGSQENKNPGSKGNEDPGSRGNEDPGSRGNEDPCSRGNEDPGSRGNEDPGSRGNEDPGSRGNEDPGSRGNKDPGSRGNKDPGSRGKKSSKKDARSFMEDVNSIMKNGTGHDSIEAIQSLEQLLEETEVNETVSMPVGNLMALLHKPKYPFEGLEIHATETEARSNQFVPNSKVSVRLPRELDAGSDNTIVFCMITWPQTNETIFGAPDVLYENRLVGLSVRHKNISGLQERVNITMTLTTGINETQELLCAYYDFSAKKYCTDGCLTTLEPGQSNITCSCNHLTYFGVLMVPANLSLEDQEILTYITQIGCSLSLIALVIALFLFMINRNVRADVSMKIHINLVIALILLNIHFLPSKIVAELSSTGLCFYVGLCTHYSLLATFSWMALEGFHIYLLLVRVFNIYVKRYLLKLAVVGWGIPAVIVSLVIIIDNRAYGHASLDSSNSTVICYIIDGTIKIATTVGVFALVFIFNVTLLGVTIRRVLSFRHTNESNSARAKRDICTIMGLTTLLGITWGLVFFSFGSLNAPGLYLFCILNSLQGFFIFLWFLMSLRKNRDSATNTGRETRSTNS
ncbi:adhesion G-protein coupled receptor G5-like isoform X2 [Trachinotus anak]|uniref:adhesion G-protein coupled receptor G5-like isoform X2 n=1 Tax=Trachinotus anak TaxID=443729 RepID=UPI0039F19897